MPRHGRLLLDEQNLAVGGQRPQVVGGHCFQFVGGLAKFVHAGQHMIARCAWRGQGSSLRHGDAAPYQFLDVLLQIAHQTDVAGQQLGLLARVTAPAALAGGNRVGEFFWCLSTAGRIIVLAMNAVMLASIVTVLMYPSARMLNRLSSSFSVYTLYLVNSSIVSLLGDDRQHIHGVLEIGQAALLGFLVPFFGVVVAVEDDLLALLDDAGQQFLNGLVQGLAGLDGFFEVGGNVVEATRRRWCSGRCSGRRCWREPPTARNSNLLPVKANGLVRLRSPASLGSLGRTITPVSNSAALLAALGAAFFDLLDDVVELIAEEDAR